MARLTSLRIENFGRFKGAFEWPMGAQLHAIIGENDTGKTQLLKLVYALTRAAEEYGKHRRGPTPKEYADLLAEKLRWIYLPQRMELGRLVSRGTQRAKVALDWAGGGLRFGFGKDTTTKLQDFQVENIGSIDNQNALFLPPKEVLSLYPAIIATREGQVIAAFDDTHYDLAQDFRQPTVGGNHILEIKKALTHLDEITGGGKVVMESEEIWFKRGKDKFTMGQIAEGIKKVGILWRLFLNRRLAPGSVLFVDEPEVNLHPKAVCLFADMLHAMAQSNIQIFLTSHNYYLIKRLEQLSRKHKTDYLLLDLRNHNGFITGQSSKLADGLPDNPIIEQSMALFQEDVRLDLGI